MNTRKQRTKLERTLDIKIGATLAFIRRRDGLTTQANYAKRLGTSRGHLSNIESGRTPLPAMLGWKFCREFDCHPTWVATAGNGPINVFPHDTEPERMEHIEKIIKANANAPFREIWPPLSWLVLDEINDGKVTERRLTTEADSLTTEDVKPVLPKLIERLKKATLQRGQKVALAKWLGVHRQSVTDWLSGKQEPGGEITLRMLKWVEAQERQK
jgi:transcriptional regulator with XRE-family HTH domain